MKHLLLVRHAKSDWGNPDLEDFDRPLNSRGKKDAPVMAQRLLDRKIRIDAFISSPAKRAAKTAKYFANAYSLKKKDILFKQELYLAQPEAFMAVISGIIDNVDTVAIFSHNEGITDFANQLTHTRIDNIPTSGVFGIKIHCNHWYEFKQSEKEFWFFDYPGTVND